MSVALLLQVSLSSYSHAVRHGGSGTRVSRMPHATHVSAACRMGVHRLGKLEVLAEVQARLSQPLYAVAEKSNYLHASFKASTCMRTQDSTCMRMQTQDSTCMRMQTHGCVQVCPLSLCKCVQVCVNVKSLFSHSPNVRLMACPSACAPSAASAPLRPLVRRRRRSRGAGVRRACPSLELNEVCS